MSAASRRGDAAETSPRPLVRSGPLRGAARDWPRPKSTCSWSAVGWSAPERPWMRSPADCRSGIVEARDWASGTSSRSSKLIHGGLRYLEMLDFGLVREALHERGCCCRRWLRTSSDRCRSSTR